MAYRYTIACRPLTINPHYIIKAILNPFLKCDLYNSQKGIPFCCEKSEKCPLNLPLRIKCSKNPCCSVGSNIIEWCNSADDDSVLPKSINDE